MIVNFQFHVYYLFYGLLPLMAVGLWHIGEVAEDDRGYGSGLYTLIIMGGWVIGILLYIILVLVLQHFFPQ